MTSTPIDHDLIPVIAPRPFNEFELNGAKELLAKFEHTLPDSLKTDHFLAMWWRMYEGNETLIDKYLTEYLENRRVLGFDVDTLEDLLAVVKRDPIISETVKFFSVSYMDGKARNGNSAMCLMKMRGFDSKQLLKTVPLSNVLITYWILQELFVKNMTRIEQETGEPGSIIAIMDLNGLNLSDYINPMGACSRLGMLVAKIWHDYFSECVVRLFIINPPGLLSVLWQVAKCIIHQNLQCKVEFLKSPEELLNHLSPEAVPVSYGGKWEDHSGWSSVPEECASTPLILDHSMYRSHDAVWKANGLAKPPKRSHVSIKSNQTVVVTKRVDRPNSKLVWQFSVNGDVEFCVKRANKDGKETLVFPHLVLHSLKLDEEGEILCKEEGEYRFYFTNTHHSWFHTKLSHAIFVVGDEE